MQGQGRLGSALQAAGTGVAGVHTMLVVSVAS